MASCYICFWSEEANTSHFHTTTPRPPPPYAKGPGLVVVRPLAHDREIIHAVEYDERELRQVDLMDLHEDLLPRAWIRCRQFLLVKGIQGRVAVEVNVRSTSLRRDLVTQEHPGI